MVDEWGERDVDVRMSDSTCVGELGTALFGGLGGATAVYIGQVPVPLATPVVESGIAAGARLSLSPPPLPTAQAAVHLDVLAGPGGGSSIGLPAGRHVFGAGEGVSVRYRAPGVRPEHMAIDVEASGASIVTAVGGGSPRRVGPATLIEVGGGLLRIARVHQAVPGLRTMPGRGGIVPFNRPPRHVPPHELPIVCLPEALKAPSSTSRFSVVALIVPIIFGITLAVLIHPRMALFALLGPVMMIGSSLEDRRRRSRFRRDSAARDIADRHDVTDQLDRAAAVEVVQRHRRIPALAELARWSNGGARMWERRPIDDDFMRLLVGYGQAPWRPATEGSRTTSAAVRTLVANRDRLPRGPVSIDLRRGRVVGVVGERNHAVELVRSLVAQAAVLHGPADVHVAIATDRPGQWQWATWLPHTMAGGGERRLLVVSPDDYGRLVGMLASPATDHAPRVAATPDETHPLTLLIVDGAPLAESHGAGLRLLLGGGAGPVAGVVVEGRRDALPSVCTTVIEVGRLRSVVTDQTGGAIEVAVAGAVDGVVRQIARNLAGFADPERRLEGAELPARVRLLDCAGASLPAADDLARRWAAAGADPPIAAPIGVTEGGSLVVDVVRDGPHALLAGTTGAGKSELLRTLVASLALAVDPDHLTFVLVDYKGGSAFDVCADLPHTVGVVTDLDDTLAARALQCLEAELRYREQRLREAGAEDIASYLAADPQEPMPRMLIVVDEFAALAKELPDFMDALVDIAARGRSLGVHLLLATQRPAGVIRDNVRANTNMRIALRVQDRSDSTDVIGDVRAASIARSQPGRGLLRLGPGELVLFQAALVSTAAGAGGRPAGVGVREVPFAIDPPPFEEAECDGAGPTDLERIVTTVTNAARIGGYRQPRHPWPEPLPELIAGAELDATLPPSGTAVPVGLVDEPDQQRQRTMWWDPDQGSLALYGLTGAGTTTALATIATGLAHRHAPDEIHMYVMDFDAGALSPLAELPHVGAVVTAAERERQVRLVRHLSLELERRKRGPAPAGPTRPRIVVIVDNYAGFTAGFDATQDAPTREALARVISEGPTVGIVAVVTGTRQNAVPLPVAATIGAKLVFRMADPLAAATFGLRRIPPDLPSGRAIHVASHRTIQVAIPHPDGLAAAVAAVGHSATAVGLPHPIDELPSSVKAAELATELRLLDEDWWLPVGLGDTDLAPVGLPLGPGDHALIAGEPRSGRSTLLRAIGETVAEMRPDVEITAIALRPSPLRELGSAAVVASADEIEAALERSTGSRCPQLVLIDDADALEATPLLREVVASRRPDLHVVGAARRDLKTHYNHWARDLCRSRVGIWLRPGPGLDGDLWSTPMPRHVGAGLPPGRGFLVAHGAVELMQAMCV